MMFAIERCQVCIEFDRKEIMDCINLCVTVWAFTISIHFSLHNPLFILGYIQLAHSSDRMSPKVDIVNNRSIVVRIWR